jgi:hypothetical protein
MGTQARAQKGWFGRNWMWFVPTAGCLTLVIAATLMAGGIFALVLGTLKSSDVYKGALTRAEQNTTLQGEIGLPIEPGFFVSGSINKTILFSRANLSFSVSGPKGKANVYVVARKSAGPWEYSVLTATVQGSGRRIELVASAADSF